MLYAAMTFWLLTSVLCAWGVHSLWSGMVKPRAVNIVLLPGTLVAQLGHVLALLITGATVTGTSLVKDDETGEPGTTQNADTRVPVIGPLALGLLPLLACAVAIFFVARSMGSTVLDGIIDQPIAVTLPVSVSQVWPFLRDDVTLVERLVDATTANAAGGWPFWVFLYLMVCLTVRMAPFPGSLRGSLGAIVLMGLLAAGLGALTDSVPGLIHRGWPVLTLTVATLLLLLTFSAAIRGCVGLVRMLIHNQ